MRKNGTLLLALLCGLLLRAFLACEVPTGFESVHRGLSWYNDEKAHVNYVAHLASERNLPVQTKSVKDSGAFARGDFEYYQPPLAYFVQIPAWLAGEALQPGMGWLAVRLFEVLVGLLTLLAARSLAERLTPGTGDAVAWMLALHPGFAYQGVLVSNDPLFWLLSILFLLVVVELPRHGPTWLLAPLTAALLLTKSSAIVLLPLPFIALTPPLVDDFRPRRLLPATLALTLGILAAAPWYFRNIQVYGSVFALEVGHGAPYDFRATLTNIPVLKMMVLYFLGSLWYPMDQILSMRLVPRILELFACAAWLLPVFVESQRSRTSRITPLLWAALALGVLAFAPYAIRYCQSEARLLFQLLPAFTALWAVSVGPRPTRWTLLAVAPCVVVWTILLVRYVVA